MDRSRMGPPIFHPEDDAFIMRFHVSSLICLDVEHAVPIKEPRLWNRLSFTSGYVQDSSAWAQKITRKLDEVL